MPQFYGGRAPHGARGLKLSMEMTGNQLTGRAPHGARGLKYRPPGQGGHEQRRAPHGARGLKYADVRRRAVAVLVAPRTGRVD